MRRPSTFIGVVSCAGLAATLIYVSDDPVFDRLFQAGSLAALVAFWFIACLTRGFSQRGLLFQPSDIEFLIPAPFRPSELIAFRLVPGYVSSWCSGLVFFALAYRRFSNPAWITAEFILFQIVCAHFAIAASGFAGGLSPRVYLWARRLLLILLSVVGAISFNAALPLAFLPDRVGQSLGQLGRLCAAPAAGLLSWSFVHPFVSVATLCAMVIIGWFQVSWLKSDFIESSTMLSEAAEDEQLLPEAGYSKRLAESSFAFSRPIFNGAWAVVWKHLLTALRRRRDLFSAALVTVSYAGAVKFALDSNLIVFAQTMETGRVGGQEYSEWQMLAVTNSIIWIGLLGLLLQRVLPFDFRSDGRRIADLRLLPVSAISVVLAEIILQVTLSLLFQSAAIGFFWFIGSFPPGLICFSLLAFTVVNIAVACVGNIFALAYSGRIGDSQTGVLSAFLLMALSLAALAPGIAAYVRLSHSVPATSALMIAIGVQSLIDVAGIILLARIFIDCELSRELQ